MSESATTVHTARSRAAEQSGTNSKRRIEWMAYLYLLPTFVILGVFHIFPVLYAIFISAQSGPVGKFRFAGAKNYIHALTSSVFWISLGTTFVYSLLTLPFTIALGLFFAYLWNSLMWPLLVTNNPLMRPIQMGIAAFITESGTQAQFLLAAVTISIIAVILLYLILQHWFIEGIATVGIRG